MNRHLLMIVGLLTLVSFGCGHRSDTSADQQGRITLAITNAPPDATCIQVVVQGTTSVERDVDVAPGQSTVLLLEGLPEGTDTIIVNAFSGSCGALTAASIPTWVWVGDPVVVLVSEEPVEVTVNLHRNTQNGRISLGINFVDDAGADAAGDAGSPDATEPDAGSDSATTITDPNCDTCELDQCPEFRSGCDAFTGPDHDLCTAVIACARRTSCHQNNTLDCYCGTADATQCLSTSGANGACKAEIEAGQKTTDPTAIQNQYTDITFPAGAAMQLMLCDNAVCNTECIPYGAP